MDLDYAEVLSRCWQAYVRIEDFVVRSRDARAPWQIAQPFLRRTVAPDHYQSQS